jgi:ribose transport system substrate-binding protein
MCRLYVTLVAGVVVPVAVFAQEARVSGAVAPILVGVSMPGGTDVLHDAMRHEIEKAAATLGVKLIARDSHWELQKQWADVEGLVAERAQGILVDNCSKMSSLAHAVEAADRAGIPVATVEDPLPNTDKVLVHVGADNVQLGREAAQFIINRLGDKGSVIELEGVFGFPSAERNKDGFDEVIKKSGVQLRASESANYTRAAAHTVMSRLIRTHGNNFDAVFAANDEMIIGAIEAISDAQIDPASKVLVGGGGSPEGLQYLKDGKLTATFDVSPGEQAATALRYLVAFIKDKTMPPQRVVLIKPQLLTKASLPAG